jgi:hypothetical protein
MEEGTSTIRMEKATNLMGCNEVKTSISITLELNNLALLYEFHGEIIIIRHDRTERFHPLNP